MFFFPKESTWQSDPEIRILFYNFLRSQANQFEVFFEQLFSMKTMQSRATGLTA